MSSVPLRGRCALAPAVLAAGIATALLSLTSPPAHAQGASVQSGLQRYDIPAQPLKSAVLRYSRVSGLQVLLDGADGDAVRSSEVQGEYAADEALRRLLAGTGLVPRPAGEGIVSLEQGAPVAQAPQRAAHSTDATTFDTIEVRAERPNYTVKSTSSATKLDLDIKDTPQTVNVITRQRMDDQNLVQIADVMNQAPAVSTVQQGVPGMGQIDYWSRGFRVTNVMLDGVTTQAAGNGNFVLWSVLDTAVFEQVDFVQGSTGLGSGMGDPSASVNFVRKRPTSTFKGEAALSYGSWDRARATVDVGGPLNASGTLRGRFVAAHQTGGTWQDRVDTRNSTAYGIVEFDPIDSLTLTAGLTWNKSRVDDAATFGINPYQLSRFPRSYNPATQWSFAEVELLNPFAKVEWHFADDWKLNASYMFSDVEQERLVGVVGQYVYDKANDKASYSWGRLRNNGQIHNADLSVSGKFEFLGHEHDMVVGFNGYRGYVDTYTYTTSSIPYPDFYEGLGWVRISSLSGNGDVPYPSYGTEWLIEPGQWDIYPGGVPNFNTYNPLFLQDMVWGGVRLGDVLPWPYRINEEQYAPYVALRLRPADRLQVILGARQDHWRRWPTKVTAIDYEASALAGHWIVTHESSPQFSLLDYNIQAKGKITPYAGVVFDVTPDITAYASYTGISKANFSDGGGLIGEENGRWPRDRHGNSLPPITGNSLEVGTKAALFDDKLNVQLTAFRMEQKNLPVDDPDALDENGNRIRFFDPLASAYVYPQKADVDGLISKGYEFNIAGQVSERVNLMLGYSRLDLDWGGGTKGNYGTNVCLNNSTGGSIYQGATVSTVRRMQCPKHSVKFFGTWQATDKFMIGGGINWKSRTGQTCWSSIGTTIHCSDDGVRYNAVFEQPSFAVVDLTARYQVSKSLGIGAYIGNVFDKTYVTSQDRYSGYYGAPRNVMVSASYKF
ncbi:MAG: TonB-dependent receptor [Pseudoxanthomonas sp.]